MGVSEIQETLADGQQHGQPIYKGQGTSGLSRGELGSLGSTRCMEGGTSPSDPPGRWFGLSEGVRTSRFTIDVRTGAGELD